MSCAGMKIIMKTSFLQGCAVCNVPSSFYVCSHHAVRAVLGRVEHNADQKTTTYESDQSLPHRRPRPTKQAGGQSVHPKAQSMHEPAIEVSLFI